MKTVIALIAVAASIAVAADSCSSTGGTSSSPAAGTSAQATTSAKAAPITLLTITGNGAKKSSDFKASGNFTINYSYDCSSFGFAGNFIVSVMNADGTPADFAAVNTQGMKASDSTIEHKSGGQYYLDINSECSWTVTVVG